MTATSPSVDISEWRMFDSRWLAPQPVTTCCGVPWNRDCDCDFTTQILEGLRRRRAAEKRVEGAL